MITIRDIESLTEMREVERLQREIWGVSDLDVFPALAMRPQKKLGGILLGAFVDERMIGFVFGFPGILQGETIIHSDMLGVLPEYRSQNLGYRLKLAQREAALAQGIKQITWTFDPLQSRNAHLNFRKLGVTANRYYVNYYGETSSFLHRSGTDRLWVTWRLERERTPPLEASELERMPALVRVGEEGEPVTISNPAESRKVVIEIPGEFDPERWRVATRAAFTSALDAGYVVGDFYLLERANQKVGCYLLTHSA